MKAELIQTKHGVSLQITALTKEDQSKLAAFMENTTRAAKPQLKILPSPDHDRILNLGFVEYFSKKTISTIITGGMPPDGELINFPNDAVEYQGYYNIQGRKLHIYRSNQFRWYAAYVNLANETVYLKTLYLRRDLDKVKDVLAKLPNL